MIPEPVAVPSDPSLREARAEVIERLCDGFSHDARNPLNAVVIHLEVLADKLRREHGGQVPYGLERNLKAIRDQVTRIDDMVRRFVELAAPHRQHEQEFDLAALAQSIVEQCTHHARLARAELRAEAPAVARVPGCASEIGVAIAGLVLAELDAGAKRLTLHVEWSPQRAQLTVEGAVPLAPEVLAPVERAVARQGGKVSMHSGRLAVQLAREPDLHVVDGAPASR